MPDSPTFQSQQDSWAKSDGPTNQSTIAGQKNLSVHEQTQVDFGFIPWIGFVAVLIGVGFLVAKRSLRLAWGFVVLLAVGSLSMLVLGLLRGENALASEGMLGVGVSIAVAGMVLTVRRSHPALKPSKPSKPTSRQRTARAAH